MNTRFVFACLLIAVFCSLKAAAQHSHLELLVLHEKDNNTFATTDNLWTTRTVADATGIDKLVDNAQLLSLDMSQLAGIMKSNNKDITIRIPRKDGGFYIVDMVRYNFLTGDFKVQTVANGIKSDYAYTPGLYYRGIVSGVPNSVATFSFFNGEVFGLISIPGEGNYNITPEHLSDKSGNTNYVLYNDRDSKVKRPGCAQETLPQISNTADNHFARNAYNTCREIKVFEKGDFALYQTASSNVTTAANYVTACLNVASTIYSNEGIYLSLKVFQINTTADAYQNMASLTSDYFLYHFGNETQNNLNGADIAMLVTTINHSLGGLAWLGTLCQPYSAVDTSGPYAFVGLVGDYVSFPAYSFDAEAITHEMGHTLGSPHTQNCSWPGGAIDGCYTLEGNCAMPVPQYPVGGGTIMSYCHLVPGVGINLTNGFGPLPGDLIRNTVATASCGNIHTVKNAIVTAATTANANRECTMNGTTFYWNDNNTADTTDDKLVLQINKNGNNIGTIDSPGFLAQSVTNLGYGSGSGTYITFPAGTSGVMDTSYAMRRYWKLKTAINPTSNIEVMFPYLQADKTDLFHSLLSPVAADTLVYMYTLSSVSPNPVLGFTGATASNFTINTKNTTLSTGNWTETVANNIHFAHVLTSSPVVGGSGFITYKNYLEVGQTNGNNIYQLDFYPNPTKDAWTVTVPFDLDNRPLQLFNVSGKVVRTYILKSAVYNLLDSGNLPVGIYFYRAIGTNVYAGKLLKE